MTDTIYGPAFLASAIINGDESGLDDDGRATLARFLLYSAGFRIVDVARDADGEPLPPFFSWNCESCGMSEPGGDLQEYAVRPAPMLREMTNNDRAAYGAAAIKAGTPDFDQNDEQTNLCDVISGLLHYARNNMIDFDEALRMALFHFEAETEEEDSGDGIVKQD